jgi:hypothetical protein
LVGKGKEVKCCSIDEVDEEKGCDGEEC